MVCLCLTIKIHTVDIEMKINVQSKLIIAFLAMIVPFMAAYVVSYHFSVTAYNSVHRLQDINGELEDLASLQVYIDMLLMPANDYIITVDHKEKKEFNHLSLEVEKYLDRILKREQQTLQRVPAKLKIIRELEDGFNKIKKIGYEIFRIKQPVGSNTAARLMKDMDGIGYNLITLHIESYREILKGDYNRITEDVNISWRNYIISRYIGFTMAIVIGITFAIFYSRLFFRPIMTIHKMADAIANGEFKTRIHIKSGDELEQLANAVNEMAAKLDDLYSNLEGKVLEKTEKLQEHVEELEQFRKLTLKREFRMRELKDRLEKLEMESRGIQEGMKKEG